MRLDELHILNCKVSVLAPIQGMPLKILDIKGTFVADLSPLKGMPATIILNKPGSLRC